MPSPQSNVHQPSTQVLANERFSQVRADPMLFIFPRTFLNCILNLEVSVASSFKTDFRIAITRIRSTYCAFETLQPFATACWFLRAISDLHFVIGESKLFLVATFFNFLLCRSQLAFGIYCQCQLLCCSYYFSCI